MLCTQLKNTVQAILLLGYMTLDPIVLVVFMKDLKKKLYILQALIGESAYP